MQDSEQSIGMDRTAEHQPLQSTPADATSSRKRPSLEASPIDPKRPRINDRIAVSNRQVYNRPISRNNWDNKENRLAEERERNKQDKTACEV